MPITVDGLLGDWTQADRIERLLSDGSNTGVAGYEVYGRFENGNFYIAIHSAVAIGQFTTLWLNTDDNAATGYQAPGLSTGAEFNINFNTSTFASLFTGFDAGSQLGQNAVSPSTGFAYALSADNLTLEVAIPKALLGANVDTISVLADVNNSIFLPGNYGLGGYRISDPATQQFDGLLTEWTASQRLELPATQVAGYEIYGNYANGDFIFALKSPVIVGANTTFWLDTDRNQLTGFQAFGNPGDTGAEFNVNIGLDGVARLYSGAAGQTLVGNIQYKVGPDGKTIEFAVPKTLVGANVAAISMKADVNDAAFLPGSYISGKYTVTDPSTVGSATPADGYRIAIVFSATSANSYFSKMAYAQLFMTAQSQAQAAGIPFDIISDTDLTLANLANLQQKHYDAIVFPSFRNVDSAHYVEIQQVLENLVLSGGVPLIAAGDFMTNDQNGAALSANPYERMVELLGVNRTGGDGNVTVNVVAGSTEITSGYTAGGTIHTYTGAFTSYFDPTNPATSSVVATQVVNGVTHNGVVGTVTGGHNVHFATEALLGDSNLLGKALDYVTAPDLSVQVSLHMSRGESIVASRTDMDQAQEQTEVNGGIYNVMLPILQSLKTQYDFVGSYYFDVGLGSLYAGTGGTQATILPFEQALLAMGNEIGSHSYTHPDDTNRLLPNQLTQAQLDAIRVAYGGTGDFTPYALVPGANQTIVTQMRSMTLADINTALTQALTAIGNPGSLDTLHQAILDATFQFQFAQSKAAIQAALGITLDGAAVPGNPDTLDTAHSILQYYNYVTGGGALVGAGYPGAIGYLGPSDGKVYIAPNVAFDFTLVGFQGLTAAQAQAHWLADLQALRQNSDQAIIVWPWHDYGITHFGTDGAPYTEAMYTAFIAAAYQAGAEFVTLDDLAQRIAAFDKASMSYTVTGDTINVTAGTTAGSLGTFALDFDSMGTKHIQNVMGWYAYDDNSVYLDADGGSFAVNLGTVTDDVTHITKIASRAKLMTLTGDGGSLTFTIVGEGKVIIDLKAVPGGRYDVSGATVVSQLGEIMTLDLGAIASHNVAVALRNPPVITSNGGGDDAAILVHEELTAVTTVTATDADVADTKTFSIAGGADQNKFTIDATTGALSFVTAPDIANPTDAGGNNVYDVIVKVADSFNLIDTQAIAVTVTDVNNPPAPPLIQVSEAAMEAGSTQKTLSPTAFVDPEGDTLTYKLTSVTGGGSLFLGYGTLVTDGQVLTQAQFLSLTYSSPQTAGQRVAHFDVFDGFNRVAHDFDLDVTAAINGTYTGTAGNDRLDGAAGNDTVNGLAGADTMIGGTGKDKYIVDNAGDRVDERGGNGIDLVQSSITFNLGNAARVFGAVENLTLTGAKVINGTGNSLANTISGNAAANVLNGGLGNDTLIGGLGKDTLIGGVGNDKLNGGLGKDTLAGGKGNDFFVFSTKPSSANLDKITDFHNVKGDNDTLQLDNAVFTKLGAVGHLKSAYFFNGTSAHDGNDHIIYNKASGALYYDSDGIGGHAQIRLATLTNHVALSAADFFVV